MTLLMMISFVFLGIYALLLLWLAYGFLKVASVELPEIPKDTPVTLIICARNEEKYMARCLSSILQQQYDFSKLQVIVVNDGSTDNTEKITQHILNPSNINYTLIKNEPTIGKKQSILKAMQQAKHELVITRDADTYTTSTLWLKSLSDFYTAKNCDMIIAPVALNDNYGLLWALQAIENNILALITSGSAHYNTPFLASGANLAFTKTIFYKTGAYANHSHIASGDDVLFLEDVKKIPDSKITYFKSPYAIVYTYPCRNLSKLINQKIRWASKFKMNKNKLNLLLAVSSFAVNLSWLFFLVYGFVQPINNTLSFVFVIGKPAFDFLLLFLASTFMKNRLLLWYSLPVGFIYPLYACVVALCSVFFKPRWK